MGQFWVYQECQYLNNRKPRIRQSPTSLHQDRDPHHLHGKFRHHHPLPHSHTPRLSHHAHRILSPPSHRHPVEGHPFSTNNRSSHPHRHLQLLTSWVAICLGPRRTLRRAVQAQRTMMTSGHLHLLYQTHQKSSQWSIPASTCSSTSRARPTQTCSSTREYPTTPPFPYPV